MKKLIIISGLFLCMSFSAFSQNIQNGSSGAQTEKKAGKNGEISVSYMGIYADGYMKYPKSIFVSYQGTINGKMVDVKYKIYSESNFNIDKDNKNLIYYQKDTTDNLSAYGFITQKNETGVDTLAILTEVVYTVSPKNFAGWLVSENSKMQKSSTASINKQGLFSSSNNIKFTGKTVTFFKIESDFSLTLDAKPISLGPKVTQTSTKPAVKK
jgi:hypothetical protein